jgi:hypothetical protein
MQFQHYDLGTLDDGAVVEVVLDGTEANVRLLSDSDLRSYKPEPDTLTEGAATRGPLFDCKFPTQDVGTLLSTSADFEGESAWGVRVLNPSSR